MNKIYIANKKSKIENIRKKYPNASIFDITSNSEYGILRVLSPFYPHGNIPVPGMPNVKAACVEAVWQGLKVFENCGVDYATLHNDTMKDIKRTVRKYGKPRGHQYGNRILNYEEARWLIYLPTYLYMLENVPTVKHTLAKIRERLEEKDVVFLDYNTNCNVTDYSKPLSHAGLVKLYLEGKYPSLENKGEYVATKKETCGYKDMQDIISAIINHPKYKGQKHFEYVDAIETQNLTDFKAISNLSGKKRDGWKTIIKDIQRPDYTKQLSLF